MAYYTGSLPDYKFLSFFDKKQSWHVFITSVSNEEFSKGYQLQRQPGLKEIFGI
jgi:hypothetical protein